MRLTPMESRCWWAGVLIVVLGGAGWSPALSQEAHVHTPAASGIPQGIPYICSNPTVVSVSGGRWSDARTWSTQRVPGANEKVAIGAGHEVVYDAVSDVPLNCIEVNGRLRFSTTTNTRMKVATLMVTDVGFLEIGSAATPVAPEVTAEIVIADRPIDAAIDPGQFGNGI